MAALLAYKRARGKASAATLLDGVRRYAAVPRGKSFYHPSPARWLDDERWRDEEHDQGMLAIEPDNDRAPAMTPGGAHASVAGGIGGMYADARQAIYSDLVAALPLDQRDLFIGLTLTKGEGMDVELTAPGIEQAEEISAQLGAMIGDRWADAGFGVQIKGRMPAGVT